MPKEFHEWVSDMAGTIDDASEFIKPVLTAPATDFQKRLYIANMLVPIVDDIDDIIDWMFVFCVIFNAKSSSLVSDPLSNIIGWQKSREYYALETEKEHLLWFSAFRHDILTGKFR